MAAGRLVSWLRRLDWPTVVTVALLVLFGIATIYSIGVNKNPPDLDRFWRQVIALGIGLVLFLVLIAVDFRIWHSLAWVLYGGAVFLLGSVLLFGAEIRGTRGWFVLEGIGAQVQPVEFAKILLILVFAKYLADRGGRITDLRAFTGCALLLLVPVSLIILQPDLGSALILVATWTGMLLIARVPRRIWLIAVVVAVLISGLAWQFLLRDYQRNRIATFVNPARDPLGFGYNIAQSMVAVGSGELLGRGLGLGPQSHLNFLPEQETDFIFAVIAEELGFIGSVLLLGLFALLLVRIFWLARRAPDDFSLFTLSGIGIVLFVQIFVNIGTNIGIVPVAGVPLPLVSYGGSALIASLAGFGIVESIAARRSISIVERNAF